VLIVIKAYIKLKQQRRFWRISLLTFLTFSIVKYLIVPKDYVSIQYFEL